MLFSGKITNSILIYLDRQGVDSEKLYDLTDLPLEFLKDPTCWIPAEVVEKFMANVDRDFSTLFPEGLAITVAHHCHQLRAWGVLDSVIRMIQKPQDLFFQPHRFLSYFISPPPPVGNVTRGLDAVSFDVPISNDDFPYVCDFIRGAFEILPSYLGYSMAHVDWQQTRLQISWSDSQSQLLDEQDRSPNYKPELVQNLMQALEDSQRQIEELRSKLGQHQAAPVARLDQSLMASDAEFVKNLRAHVVKTRGQIMRLSDYFIRAQQLVTLLVGQNRMDRQVQEAMKRVDWDYVKNQSSQTAQQTAELLNEFENDLVRREKLSAKPHSRQRTLDLN